MIAFWKLHCGVVTVIFIVAATTPCFVIQLSTKQPFANMIKVRNLVMRNPEVTHANINDSIYIGTTEITYTGVQVFLNSNQIENSTIARNIGTLIVNNHSKALSKSIIQVNLTFGYDTGIRSFWRTQNYVFKSDGLVSNTNVI